MASLNEEQETAWVSDALRKIRMAGITTTKKKNSGHNRWMGKHGLLPCRHVQEGKEKPRLSSQ